MGGEQGEVFQEGCGCVRIWRKSIPKRRTVMLMPFGGDKQEEGTCDGRRKSQARLETRLETEGLHPLGKPLEGSE